MTAIYPVTFVMSAVLICKWTLSHYDDDDDDDDVFYCSGADVNAQTEETQETALTLACCGGFLEIADLLVNSGANLELGCSTPLMEAAQEGHVDLVKYLIAAGV